MRILVVGGGISGLFLSNLLLKSGINVDVVEEDSQIGYPQHCAGVVSPKVVNILKSFITYKTIKRDIILNELNSLKVSISNLATYTYLNTKKVYIINRKKLEELLALHVLNNGGHIILGKRVNIRRNRRNGGIKIFFDDLKENSYDYIVIAAGAKVALLRVGLNGILPAFQLDIQTKKSVNQIIEIIIDKNVNPDFFTWIIPLNDDVLRIGTAGKNPLPLLLYLIKSMQLDKYKVLNKYFGHVIIRGPILPFYSGKYVFIGDAAGQNKITTGGGIYYSLIASILLSICIINKYDLKIYQKNWINRFKKELIMQKKLRKIFIVSNNKLLKDLINILNRYGIIQTLVKQGDIDDHALSMLASVYNQFIYKFLKYK